MSGPCFVIGAENRALGGTGVENLVAGKCTCGVVTWLAVESTAATLTSIDGDR